MPQRTPNSFRLSSVIVTIRASMTICSMGLSSSAINFLIFLTELPVVKDFITSEALAKCSLTVVLTSGVSLGKLSPLIAIGSVIFSEYCSC